MKQPLYLLTKNVIPALIPNDAAVVLMQDATYLLLRPLQYQTVYAVNNELLARGIDSGIATVIDYSQLVTLTAQYDQVITWT